jgi:hypothetical protein
MGQRQVTEDIRASIKSTLNTLLAMQVNQQNALFEIQIQLNALGLTLVSLDHRAAAILSEQIEVQRDKLHTAHEIALQEIALLQATVSKTVQ